MIVDQIASATQGSKVDRTARVRWDGGEAQISMRIPATVAGPAADASPWLALTILAAMSAGEDLRIEGAVSPRLLEGIDSVVTAWCAWDERLHPTVIEVAASTRRTVSGPGHGCFFSRGVDSMVAAARSGWADPTHLIYCDGLSIELSESTAAAERQCVREAAAALGRPLVVVETDVRHFLERFGRWADLHGSAMAGIALALSGAFGRVTIPSTDSFATVVPFGSSPVLDPQYSTEVVEVLHDDVSLARVGKVACLAAQRPDLLPHLKVCFSHDRTDNCGRCGKCVLTMASLLAVDALPRATSFPGTIDVDALAAMHLNPLQSRMHWVSVLRALDAHGVQGEVREAISTALRRTARPGPGTRIRFVWEWARGRRAHWHPSWPDLGRTVDWRHQAKVLSLLVDGTPFPPLGDEPESPLVRLALRPPGSSPR